MENTVNQRVKFLREMLKKEQKDFANALGLSQSGYSSLERGRTQFKISQIDVLVEHFGLDKDYLLNYDKNDDTMRFIWGPEIKKTKNNEEYFASMSVINKNKLKVENKSPQINSTPQWADELMKKIDKLIEIQSTQQGKMLELLGKQLGNEYCDSEKGKIIALNSTPSTEDSETQLSEAA